jgi:hypothetical protein
MKNTKFKTFLIRIRRFGFSEFEIYLSHFVSDFDIRISNLIALFRICLAREYFLKRRYSGVGWVER